VPRGFALTVDAYRDFLASAGIYEELFRRLARIKVEELEALTEERTEVRNLIEAAPVPREIRQAIVQGYRELERSYGHGVPVAVRSSATVEDLPTASFAGQQDTYLWVAGADEVVKYVVKCWSSLFTRRAIAYRVRMGFPHEKVLMSVGVQKMVNAKAAGVMFTLSPTTGDPSKVVIESGWGLGESVVQGEITPDKYVVNKVTMEIEERRVSAKALMHVPDGQSKGVVKLEVPPALQGEPSLTDDEVLELARVGKVIERHFGGPQDVEWAVDKDLLLPESVFMVQSRPETVWSQRQKGPIFTPRESTLDYVVDVLIRGKKLR